MIFAQRPVYPWQALEGRQNQNGALSKGGFPLNNSITGAVKTPPSQPLCIKESEPLKSHDLSEIRCFAQGQASVKDKTENLASLWDNSFPTISHMVQQQSRVPFLASVPKQQTHLILELENCIWIMQNLWFYHPQLTEWGLFISFSLWGVRVMRGERWLHHRPCRVRDSANSQLPDGWFFLFLSQPSWSVSHAVNTPQSRETMRLLI